MDLACWGQLALISLIPATVIWLLSRRTGASLVNIVPLRVKEFEQNNPDRQIIIAGATKARKLKSDRSPRYGLGWAVSRRSVLFLTEDGLHCGNWFLPLNTITEATIIKTPAEEILKVGTSSDQYYQFGLKNCSAWEAQSVLPIMIERSNLVLSVTSIAFRLGIVGYLLWVGIRDFVQQRFNFNTVFYLALTFLFLLPIIRRLITRIEQNK